MPKLVSTVPFAPAVSGVTSVLFRPRSLFCLRVIGCKGIESLTLGTTHCDIKKDIITGHPLWDSFFAYVSNDGYIDENKGKGRTMTTIAHRHPPPLAQDAAIARVSGQLLSRYVRTKTPLKLRVAESDQVEPIE